MLDERGFGVFGGEGGVTDLYEVKELPLTGEGITYQVTCDECGQVQRITIAWAQIAQAAAMMRGGGLPIDPDNRQPWVYNQGKIHPNIGCINGNCRRPISIGLTPDEAMKKLAAAQHAGLIQIRG
jgi:YD repeat-containing protein